MSLIKKIAKNRPRAFLDKQHVLGPMIHEIQDAVETSQTAITTNKALIETFTIPVSFESGEQCDYVAYFDSPVTILNLRSTVTKALAATDAGTITAKNNAGTGMTSGVLTHPLSAALGNLQTATPSANNTLAAGEKLTLTTAKTTAGGKALVTVTYTYQ